MAGTKIPLNVGCGAPLSGVVLLGLVAPTDKIVPRRGESGKSEKHKNSALGGSWSLIECIVFYLALGLGDVG